MNAEALPDPHNYWLPNSYNDVMMCPNIWEGPIQKELAVMKKYGVWTVVDPPEGARLVKTHWTFANKYNADEIFLYAKLGLLQKVSHRSLVSISLRHMPLLYDMSLYA